MYHWPNNDIGGKFKLRKELRDVACESCVWLLAPLYITADTCSSRSQQLQELEDNAVRYV